jgi:hypothetical protein
LVRKLLRRGNFISTDDLRNKSAGLHRLLQPHDGQAIQVDLPRQATPCLISSTPASLTPGCTSNARRSRFVRAAFNLVFGSRGMKA